MKKLALFAAAMTAGAALADVTSANCVGYMTTAIGSGKLQMMTVPFNHVGNDGKGLMLNSDLKVANPKDSTEWKLADQIWVWVPSNEAYKKFYYYKGEYGEGWCETTGDENFFEDCAGYENGLPEGSAFYYNAKAGEGKAATGSGEVESEPEYEIPLAGGRLTMVANPYPVATFLNDKNCMTCANPKDSTEWKLADQIWVWVPSNEAYKKFYYYKGEYGEGWCETTGDENFFEDCAGYENGLPPGSTFFYNAKAGTGKNIVFKKTF